MVDQAAKEEMVRSGLGCERWESESSEMRDQYRLLALDRFRRLATPEVRLAGHETCHQWTETIENDTLRLDWPCGLQVRMGGGWMPLLHAEVAWSRHQWGLANPGSSALILT